MQENPARGVTWVVVRQSRSLRGALAVALVAVLAASAVTPAHARSVPARSGAAAAPPWAPSEERRAPKMPDGGKRWQELTAPIDLDAFVDGLLICKVGIATKSQPTYFPHGGWRLPAGPDWDTFNGPDPLIRFRFGGDAPISLWGPEDHWEMFISVPRVTLRRGEAVRIDVWDRDVTANEFIGTIKARFDGHFPWEVAARYLRFDCRGADARLAREWAAPWEARLDGALAAIEAAEPDENRFDFGTPPQIDGLKRSLRLGTDVNFRYYAGFLGWDADEVHARLERFAALEAAWNARVREKVRALVAAAVAPSAWADTGNGWSMRVEPTTCHRATCIAVSLQGGALPCHNRDFAKPSSIGELEVSFVDDEGHMSSPLVQRLDDNGRAVECGDTPAQRFLLEDVPRRAVLLRLERGPWFRLR
jgi:hypothetical protein